MVTWKVLIIEEVVLILTKAEALALYEWLHRNEDREDNAERAGYPDTGYYDILDSGERVALRGSL
jgi:hypothetical protein